MRNQRGTALVMSLLAVLIISGIAMTTMGRSLFEKKMVVSSKQQKQAAYAAEAGLQHARTIIAALGPMVALGGIDGDPTTTADNGLLPGIGNSLSLPGSTITYKVLVSNNGDDPGGQWTDTDDKVVVTSEGSYGLSTSKIQAMLRVATSELVPALKGVVSVGGDFEMRGKATLDARDHDMDGNILGGGMLTLSTGGTVSISGSASLGGETENTSIPPTTDPATYAPLITTGDPSAQITTPDAALGLAPGTLKSIAQNQTGGSQYSDSGSGLNFPLTGVTFIDGDWKPGGTTNFTNSTGILVVNGNYTIGSPKGAFKGLIIVMGDIVNFHGDILGGVIATGTVSSNGGGEILFSSAAITNALASVGLPTNGTVGGVTPPGVNPEDIGKGIVVVWWKKI